MVDGEWQRIGTPDWLVGEEAVASENITTGMVIRTVEDHVTSQAMAGREMDVIVIRPDKRALSQITRMFGQERGDSALAVCHDIVRGATRNVVGDSKYQAAYMMHPRKGDGDELI